LDVLQKLVFVHFHCCVDCQIGKRQEIKFNFDLQCDTADDVATEMVKELNLADSAKKKLADGIERAVAEGKKRIEAQLNSGAGTPLVATTPTNFGASTPQKIVVDPTAKDPARNDTSQDSQSRGGATAQLSAHSRGN
jgi:hypothetical protein